MPTFIPPASVARNAQRALDVRETKPVSERGMTPVGLARANQLAKREPVSLETVQRMVAYFERHEVDKDGSTWMEKGRGWQAWNGWGGDEGWLWARNILKENDMETKVSRRHSASDMKLIRVARKNLMDTLNVLVELGDDGEDDPSEAVSEMPEQEAGMEPTKRYAAKSHNIIAALTPLLEHMMVMLRNAAEEESAYAEDYTETEDTEAMMKAEADRDTTPAERAEMPAEDFVFPDTMNFPVVTPDDIPAAVASWGRYEGAETFDSFKQKLIELAQRKGQEFVDALPAEWLAEMDTEAVDNGATMQVSDDMKALARMLLGGR
jgi:hypothetical protein